MFVGSIIGWLIAGLIVGAFARLLIPGRQDMGIGLTIVLGIVGALVGGSISSFIFGPNLFVDGAGNAYAVDRAWPGWIMAVLGGALVLWITLMVAGSDRARRP